MPRGGVWFRRVVPAAAALAAAVAYGFVAVHKQLASGNDFPLYYEAARALVSGASPYDVTSGLHGYVYPIPFALALVPLSFLPLPVAVVVWYGVDLAACAWCVREARFLLLSHSSAPEARLAGWFPLAVLLPLFLDNLALGQVNPLILGLCLSGVRLAMKGGGDLWAGLCFGVAAAIKPYSLVLAGPLLARRRLGAAAGAVGGLVAAAVLVPLLVFGPVRTGGLLSDWFRKVAIPAGSGTLQGSKIWDQSPHAALRRLVVDDPAFDDRRVNLVDWGRARYRSASRATTAAVAIGLAILWLWPRKKDERLATLLDFALGFCGMLLIVGYNLKAQFVYLLLPLGLAMARVRGAARGAIVAAGGLILLSTPGLVGREASNWLLAYSTLTLATLLVTLVLAADRLFEPQGLDRIQGGGAHRRIHPEEETDGEREDEGDHHRP